MRRYENVEVSKLKPYKNNARTHNETQIEKIANSIKEFGFINPILIDSNYEIIAGHGRVLGAKKLELKEVPCIFIEDLTEAQKKAYILADNKLALDAGWDDEILKIELKELKELDFNLNLTGFEDWEMVTNNEIDIDKFFEDKGEEKEKEPKKIQCPHCGEWFDL